MNIDEQLKAYKNHKFTEIKEEQIQKTICFSKQAFISAEQQEVLSYGKFLYLQFQMIQKKWWMLQAAVLAFLWTVLSLGDDVLYVSRSMGVMASLFIILIVPELWKNISSNSMEIEATTYYSLRQVYSARMLLFGIIDILLLTVFCGVVSVTLQLSLTAMLIHFLFPMAVTAGICFAILCSKHFANEFIAIGLCVMWNGLWWFILMEDRIYRAITTPVWIVFLGLAVVLLVFMAYRSIHRCDYIWEGEFYGTEIN